MTRDTEKQIANALAAIRDHLNAIEHGKGEKTIFETTVAIDAAIALIELETD